MEYIKPNFWTRFKVEYTDICFRFERNYEKAENANALEEIIIDVNLYGSKYIKVKALIKNPNNQPFNVHPHGLTAGKIISDTYKGKIVKLNKNNEYQLAKINPFL
jgi:hypothetical protein